MLRRIRIHRQVQRDPIHRPRNRAGHDALCPDAGVVQLRLMPIRNQWHRIVVTEPSADVDTQFRQRHVLNSRIRPRQQALIFTRLSANLLWRTAKLVFSRPRPGPSNRDRSAPKMT